MGFGASSLVAARTPPPQPPPPLQHALRGCPEDGGQLRSSMLRNTSEDILALEARKWSLYVSLKVNFDSLSQSPFNNANDPLALLLRWSRATHVREGVFANGRGVRLPHRLPRFDPGMRQHTPTPNPFPRRLALWPKMAIFASAKN